MIKPDERPFYERTALLWDTAARLIPAPFGRDALATLYIIITITATIIIIYMYICMYILAREKNDSAIERVASRKAVCVRSARKKARTAPRWKFRSKKEREKQKETVHFFCTSLLMPIIATYGVERRSTKGGSFLFFARARMSHGSMCIYSGD